MKKILPVLLSSLLVGCIYVPTPKHGLRCDLKISPQHLEKINVGKTTLTDVLLAFGEPTIEIKETRTFAYLWQEREGYLFGVGVAGAGMIMLPVPVYAENHEFVAVLMRFNSDQTLNKLEQKRFDPQGLGPHLTRDISEFVSVWSDDLADSNDTESTQKL
jgi:hypothetical protein